MISRWPVNCPSLFSSTEKTYIDWIRLKIKNPNPKILFNVDKHPIINCHTHLFIAKDVPPFVAKKFIPWPFFILTYLPAILYLYKRWKKWSRTFKERVKPLRRLNSRLFTIPFYGDHVSLFTLLMAASTILYTWSNSQVTSIQGPMKTMQYIMPVMLLFFLNNYSSGLTFYYFVSNISSFGLIAPFKKFVDEDKIKKALDENRKKNANKKKSSFQQRLEEAMKTREEQKKKVKKK